MTTLIEQLQQALDRHQKELSQPVSCTDAVRTWADCQLARNRLAYAVGPTAYHLSFTELLRLARLVGAKQLETFVNR